MIRLLLVVTMLISIGCPVLSAQNARTVSAADFGARPGDTINDRPSLQRAIDFCRNNKVRTLFIPPGTYRLSDTAAIRLRDDALSGKLGKNPQDVVFTPYFPYVSGVSLKGIENLTVEASGVFLMAEGWMEPLSIVDCKNITVRGVTIDYSDLPHSEGRIINSDTSFFDVAFSQPYDTRIPMLITRIMFWDTRKNRVSGSSLYFPKKQEWLSDSLLRIWGKYREPLTGSMALIDHSFHFRPAILIQDATNTTLERVTIHAQPGMGIVGNRSTDIFMKGLRVVPRPGKYQSTNTDATHFTSCKGTIRFDGCSFEGQGDDATNVHGYYHYITKKIAPSTYSIQLDQKFTTHAAVLDYPDKGDSMELVSRKTLEVAGTYRVAKVDTFPAQWESHVRLNKALPENISDYYLINITRLPRLEFVNNHVGSHLARAVLVKTRSVLIENNTFRESTGTAVHIGAEGNWREGPGSADVIIRNNRFIRCGRGDGTNDEASAIAINVLAPAEAKKFVHKNILIEGNIIEGEDSENGISISGAGNVTVRYNEITGCSNPVRIRYSDDVKVYSNLGLDIKY